MKGKQVEIRFHNGNGFQNETVAVEDIINSKGETMYLFRFKNNHVRVGHPTEVQRFV